MRKRTQFLRWGGVVIILLAVTIFAIGTSPAAKAATRQENPPPFQTCELTWKDGGGGNVALNLAVITDPGLNSTLQNYNLLCTDVNTSMCWLAPTSFAGTSGTPLDLSNIQTSSPWIYSQLNGKYTLGCGNNPGSSSSSGIHSPDRNAPLTLGNNSGSIYHVDNCPYVDSFTGISIPDDYFDITFDGAHVDCFATAGTLLVTFDNVSKVCTGNNTGYIIGTFDNGATFVKNDFPNKNQCYPVSPTIPVVRQITIN